MSGHLGQRRPSKQRRRKKMKKVGKEISWFFCYQWKREGRNKTPGSGKEKICGPVKSERKGPGLASTIN